MFARLPSYSSAVQSAVHAGTILSALSVHMDTEVATNKASFGPSERYSLEDLSL